MVEFGKNVEITGKCVKKYVVDPFLLVSKYILYNHTVKILTSHSRASVCGQRFASESDSDCSLYCRLSTSILSTDEIYPGI